MLARASRTETTLQFVASYCNRTKLRTQVNGGGSDAICGDLPVIWCFDVMLDINMIHGCIFSPEFLCFLGNTCFESVETNLLRCNLWLGLKFMCCSEICMG
jgi:hypothetical protein